MGIWCGERTESGRRADGVRSAECGERSAERYDGLPPVHRIPVHRKTVLKQFYRKPVHRRTVSPLPFRFIETRFTGKTCIYIIYINLIYMQIMKEKEREVPNDTLRSVEVPIRTNSLSCPTSANRLSVNRISVNRMVAIPGIWDITRHVTLLVYKQSLLLCDI